MCTRNLSRAWVITTSDFTPEGYDKARITNVTIMNEQDLLQSLELYCPERFTYKKHYCSKRAIKMAHASFEQML